MKPCPHCGRSDFGNKGARKQHVVNCNDSQGNSEVVEATAEPEVVPVDDQQENQRQSDLATPSDGSVEDLGGALAESVSRTFDEDTPVEERKEGISTLTQLIAGAGKKALERRRQKQERQEQRAKNADIEPVEDKPHCQSCGATFTHIPQNAERIQCGNCGKEYVVK